MEQVHLLAGQSTRDLKLLTLTRENRPPALSLLDLSADSCNDL